MSLPVEDKNRTRWLAWWRKAGAHGDPDSVYATLVSRYYEPHRAYHNLRHVSQVLDEFEAVRSLSADADAIEMALWFHDVVYDPHSADNEERSAQFVMGVSKHAGLDELFAERVAELIRVTKHQVLPSEISAQIVVDADLSILGQPPEVFDEYERQIRQEYDWVPSVLFRMKRGKILRSFLERPSIYSTPLFRTKYEAIARGNLERSIDQLRGKN